MAMTSASNPEPARFAEFRQAERRLWDYYGVRPAERLVRLDHKRQVRLHEIGDGEPILFVHGTGGSGVYFAPLVKELAASFRCILMDRPGWTLSSPIDYSTAPFGTVAAELQKDLLTSLEIDRAHIVGGSIGNLYALRLALEHPDRVRNIVLLGGLPASGITPPVFLRLLRSPIGQIIIRIPQRPQMIRKQLAGLGHKESLDRGIIPDEYIDMKAAESRFTDALKHERDLVRSVLGSDGFQPGLVLSPQDLATIRNPTLMVYGGDDPLGSEELWRGFTAGLPNASLHIAPDSGHLPWFDRTDDVVDLIHAHLQMPTNSPA